MVLYYPDISYYQGSGSGKTPIDLTAVYNAGYAGLCAKIGQGAGTKYGQTTDPDWPSFRDKGRALWPNTFWGYWYIGGTESPGSQASRCAAYIGDPTIPIMLDWEDDGGEFSNVVAVKQAFEAAGLKVTGVYLRKTWADAHGGTNIDAQLGSITVVQARYYDTSVAGPDYLYSQVPASWWNAFDGATPDILQFSQNCTIISGWNIDCNAFRGTQAELAQAINGSSYSATPGGSSTTSTGGTVSTSGGTSGPAKIIASDSQYAGIAQRAEVIAPLNDYGRPMISSDCYRTLRQSHGVKIRVTAYTASGGIAVVPATAGSVTFDSANNVRRQASVNFPNTPELWPGLDAFGILSPWGTELGFEYGVILPGKGVEWIPLMRGPIMDTKRDLPRTDTISVTVSDRCAYLSDDRFDVSTSTTAGKTVTATISDLIHATLPGAIVYDLTGNTTPCPVVDMQQDRLAGVVSLAKAIGAEVYCRRDGEFQITNVPTLDDASVFNLSGAGLIVKASEDASRDTAYNRVRASGQSNSGTTTTASVPPVYAVSEDTDPLSPTRIGGPFGRKTRFFVSSLLTTVAQCQSAADSLLAKVKGASMSVEVSAMVDPTLDAGLCGTVSYIGNDMTHLLDSVNIPFGVGDTQSIKSRSADIPDEQSDSTT